MSAAQNRKSERPGPLLEENGGFQPDARKLAPAANPGAPALALKPEKTLSTAHAEQQRQSPKTRPPLA